MITNYVGYMFFPKPCKQTDTNMLIMEQNIWYSVVLLIALEVCLSVESKKNVLFLASDDMRPQIGAYSGKDFPDETHPKMFTPNLDSLAAKSLLLKRAYVQQAVCSPSRTSILTGRRPDTTHVYDLLSYWRTVSGNFTTIPQYFKEHGYRTIGMGKIFHPGKLASNSDDPISWTDKYFHGSDGDIYGKYESLTHYEVEDNMAKQHPLIDQQTANHAIQSLKEVAEDARLGKQSFFIAVGFHRPHLPWIVPKQFYDLYPVKDVKLPPNSYAPIDMPDIAWSSFDELRGYRDIANIDYNGHGSINTTLPDDIVLGLRRAYYASISYTDSLIGQVLKELDNLGLSNNTIVSFWGDHGWQIGEHGEWCKHTNFDLATHAPMMIHIPGMTDDGIETEQLTEFVDLFPTLVDAAELPTLPLCPELNATKVKTCTEGSSLIPLLKNISVKWKSAAFSQYPRMDVDGNHIMGYTMRTDRYRFTEWIKWLPGPRYEPIWKHVAPPNSIELYDHLNDPQENINRAFDANFTNIVKKLKKKLRKGWRYALPSTI